jgi:ArsR family transcriptional regulator
MAEPRKRVRNESEPMDESADPLFQVAEKFKMLSDVSRLKILLALARQGEMHVSALKDLLGSSQPAVSHHLTLMRLAGLVSYRKGGKNNYYRLDSRVLQTLLEQFFDDAGNGTRQLQFKDFVLTLKEK